MTQTQTQEADGSVLRIFIITKEQVIGQVEARSTRQILKGTEPQAERSEPGGLENKNLFHTETTLGQFDKTENAV